jgi:hypothetical protein
MQQCRNNKRKQSTCRNMYMFYWVSPRRQIKFCRRFGTLCQVHLQRHFIRHIVPLNMDLTEGSETSATLNLTPWRHPIEHIHDSEHGENLKSRILVEKSDTVPLCPPKFLHREQTDQTQTSVGRSQ